MFKKLTLGTLLALFAIAMGGWTITAQAAPNVESQALSAPAATSLSAAETDGLLYMFEEEKLARDVYTALYAQWGQATFQNIAASEQIHMDAIATLLTRFGIAVPGTAAGVFNNTALQSLYKDLLAKGSLSYADALKVGATIEEVDITDLRSRLAQTTNSDIQFVYNNLMSGSYNHLRNFAKVLNRLTGETYQPQYLDADLYQSIVTGSNGKGYGMLPNISTSSNAPRLVKGQRGGR